MELNRGGYFPSPTSLNMPDGVTATDDWLLGADTANSRLPGWRYRSDLRSLPGSCADAVMGRGHRAIVADSGNNRILLWRLK